MASSHQAVYQQCERKEEYRKGEMSQGVVRQWLGKEKEKPEDHSTAFTGGKMHEVESKSM